MESRSVDVRQFGATGNGTTDDSAAVQAALTEASSNPRILEVRFPPGIYLCNRNLYFENQVNLTGVPGAELRLDGDLDLADGEAYYILAGVPAKGAVGQGWRNSTISGLRFTTGPAANVSRFFNLIYAEDVEIRDCVFDFRDSGFGRGTPIEGLNNGDWNAGPHFRRNIRILNNRMVAAQTHPGGEALGMGDADGVIISGNFTEGFGDDFCGIHNCTNVIVTGNHFKTIVGRCVFNDSRNCVFAQNTVERIADGAGVRHDIGSMIYTEIEQNNSAVPAPANIHISHNHFIAPSWFNSGYVVRLQGVQGAVVANNTLDIAGRVAGIFIQAATKSGWTGPAGNPDEWAGGKSRPRRHVVSGNVVNGSHMENAIGLFGPSADLVGPFVISDNIAPSYVCNAERVRFAGNVSTAGDGRGFSNVKVYPGMEAIAFVLDGLKSNTFQTMRRPAVTDCVMHNAGRILGVTFAGSPKTSTPGGLIGQATINGLATGTSCESGQDISARREFQQREGMVFSRGDRVGFSVRTAQAETAGPFSVEVTLHCLLDG